MTFTLYRHRETRVINGQGKKNQVVKGSNSDPKGHEKEKVGLILLSLLTEKNKRKTERRI